MHEWGERTHFLYKSTKEEKKRKKGWTKPDDDDDEQGAIVHNDRLTQITLSICLLHQVCVCGDDA